MGIGALVRLYITKKNKSNMKSSSKIALMAAGVVAGMLWCIRKKKQVSGVGSFGGDDAVARELLLWYENSRDLYVNFHVPLRDNLLKKLKKGIELSEEYLANSSMVDKIVRETWRSYCREFGNFSLSTADRKMLKRMVAQNILADAQDVYEYDLKH